MLTVDLYPLPENAQWSHGVLYTDHTTVWVPYPKVDQDGTYRVSTEQCHLAHHAAIGLGSR